MMKAVIFDLDGTLLDRIASVENFIDSQYERFTNFVGHIPKENYTQRFIELDNHGYVWKDQVYQQLIREFDIRGITWQDLLLDYENQFRNSCVPFPNLISMLKELKSKNLILGMITNGYGQFQMGNIKALGIEPYFQTILISEWEGIKKPDPQIFLRALEQLNVSPKQSIYVGDHPENDIKAAELLGMKGIWKKNVQWNSFEGNLIIDDLAELPAIISNLSIQSKY